MFTQPSPSNRTRSRDRSSPSFSSKHATGHLAAHAFNLMVTLPQNLTQDDPAGLPHMNRTPKLSPNLLAGGNHYEADISNQLTSFGFPFGGLLWGGVTVPYYC